MAEPSTTRAARRRSWRGIRPRLVAILLIPTLAALGLGGLRMATAARDSNAAARAASIANVLPASFKLALQLQVERDTAAARRITPADIEKYRNATDAAIQVWRRDLHQVDSSHDSKLRHDLDTIGASLGSMGELRARLEAPDTRLPAQTQYTDTLNLLLGLAGRLPDLGAAHELYRQASALGEVRTAAEALADQRTIVNKALTEGRIDHLELTQLAEATATWAAARDHFYDNTSPLAQREFDSISGRGDQPGAGIPMQAAVESLLSTGDLDGFTMNLATWNAASGDFLAQMTGVVTTAATDLADAVEARRVSARSDALVSAATVLVVLLLALLSAGLVARSILRPLERLREAAHDIARRGLPERVRALEESDEAVDLSVSPISVGSHDEIAEVAEAFDAVHTEAVRLAGEQTRMRANVNRMFVNLSRRSQSLVERQLRLIDELESGEQDPDHLANLFRLDHLATRMRRNDESLMVIAGGDTGQGARGPVPVLDVLRAASSEVEQFARVEIESGETAKFRGSVAGDLVHLLAELIENATNFSPPDTAVVVRSTRTSPVSPLVVEIRDVGIGMTPSEMDAANEKLRSSAGLDADVARMMGLVVASRLAERHGLAVELRPNSPRGVVARVEVPAGVLVQPETRSPLLVDAVDTVPGPPDSLPPSPSRPEQLRLPERPTERPEPAIAEAAATDALGPTSGPAANAEPPVASEPPVESWFTTTVPLRDPEELLNTYLTGRAEGVDGAIKNPFPAIARRNGATIAGGDPFGGDPLGDPFGGDPFGGDPLTGNADGVAATPSVDRLADRPGPQGGTPAEPPLTSSGLPTRIPRGQQPTGQPFDAFGSGTAPAAAPRPEATPPRAEPGAGAGATGPVLDPLTAGLAADVLGAPTAEETFGGVAENDDDTSIFATLQSEWFTRRTPLEARRAHPDTTAEDEQSASGWVSPGDEGWRRAAELATPADEQGGLVTADGLPVRVPGRNLVPGSAAPPPTPAAENVVSLPRLERRRTRGLSSFQQGVSRARTADPGPAESSDKTTLPGDVDATGDRAHEEHQ